MKIIIYNEDQQIVGYFVAKTSKGFNKNQKKMISKVRHNIQLNPRYRGEIGATGMEI
jgi:hypothetical protein